MRPYADKDDEWLCRCLAKAEEAIQKAMLELAEELEGSGYRADHVNVDTRNFGNMHAEVLVSKIGD